MLRSGSLAASLALFFDAVRRWRELLITDLLARILVAVVLLPVTGLLLQLCLRRSSAGVLSDQDILYFLADPRGLSGVILVAALALAIALFELGCLMVIAREATMGRTKGVAGAIVAVARHGRAVVALALRLILRLLIIILPCALALAGVYLLLLRDHDINYYLAEKPPRFWVAVAMAGILAAGMATVLLLKLVTWSLALPLVLFSGVPGHGALRASAQVTLGSRPRIVRWLLAWLILLLLMSVASILINWLAGQLLVPRGADSLFWLAVGLAAFLIISAAGQWVVSFLAMATLAVMLVQIHREISSLATTPTGESSPPAPESTRKLPTNRALLAVGALALVVSAGGTFLSIENLRAEEKVQVIAHRGASADAPENTLAAFARAIADRADWIELDVQETADGVVVVQHDSDFMKSAGVALRVWQATAADLAAIDIGSWYSPEFSAERVPTLAEALQLAKGRINVLIELKYYGHDQDLEARVVDVVEAAGMTSNVQVMSLKHEGVRKVAALRPTWPCGVLSTVAVGDLTRLEVDFLGVTPSTATRKFIRRAHRQGMEVYVWTVNDPIEMSRLMSRGVDGLITDEPELARRVQEFRTDLTPIGRLVLWMAIESGLLRDIDDAGSGIRERGKLESNA